MTSSASNRHRLEVLEEFVLAWDRWIGLSQALVSIGDGDPRRRDVEAQRQLAQMRVVHARQKIGPVTDHRT